MPEDAEWWMPLPVDDTAADDSWRLGCCCYSTTMWIENWMTVFLVAESIECFVAVGQSERMHPDEI